jgi:hypothetical protein
MKKIPSSIREEIYKKNGFEMSDAIPKESGSVNIGEQNIVQDGLTFIQKLSTSGILTIMKIKRGIMKKPKMKIMVLVVSQIHQKLNMIPLIHLSNLMQNT